MVESVFRHLVKRSLEVNPPPPVPYLCILPVLSTLMLMFLGALRPPPPPKKKKKHHLPFFMVINCSLGVKQEVYEVVEK